MTDDDQLYDYDPDPDPPKTAEEIADALGILIGIHFEELRSLLESIRNALYLAIGAYLISAFLK